MNFTTDYKVLLLKEGTYEARIEEAKYGKTESGAEYINLAFRIREDVEQEGQGEIVYDSLWKNKTTGDYTEKRLNNLCKSAGIPEGKNFADEAEFVKIIKGSLLRINVIIKFDDYTQEDKNQILFFQKTEHTYQELGTEQPQQVQQVQTAPPTKTTAPEDDLPWNNEASGEVNADEKLPWE